MSIYRKEVLSNSVTSDQKLIWSYLSKGRMNVEEEGVVDVPTAHLPKMSLVPTNKEDNN